MLEERSEEGFDSIARGGISTKRMSSTPIGQNSESVMSSPQAWCIGCNLFCEHTGGWRLGLAEMHVRIACIEPCGTDHIELAWCAVHKHTHACVH